jgi:hypothetical protein
MPPVHAQDVSIVFRYGAYDGYYGPDDVSRSKLWVIIDIYAPEAWDDTSNGIVGWTFDVHVDPAVLSPDGAYGATFGYYLYDYCDWYGYTVNYPSLLVGEINTTTGDIVDAAEFLLGYEELGKGAVGSSDPDTGWYGLDYGLVRLRFTVLDIDAYSPIEITDAHYWTPDGAKHAVDSVEYPGHYNAPPVPEFPLGAAVEVGLIVAVAYIWWTRRRKLREVPY